MRKLLNKELSILGIVSLVIILTIDALKYIDHDILWHFKLGEEIIRTHSVSTYNTLTWQPDTLWIQHEWLYDIFIYFIINYADVLGIALIFLANILALMLVGKKTSKPKYLLLYLIFITLMLEELPRNNFNRPAEFSVWFILFIVWIYDKDIRHKRYIIAFTTLFFANFHGGIILTSLAIYLIMLAIDILCDKLNKVDKDKTNKIIRNKLIDILLVAVVGLINPSGIDMYTVSLKVSTFESTNIIIEWQNLELGYISAILIITIVIAIGYTIKKNGVCNLTFRRCAVGCALLVLTFVARKAAILFVFYSMFYLYEYIEYMIVDIIKINKIDRELYRLAECLVVMLFILRLILFINNASLGGIRNIDTMISENQPNKIIEYLKINTDDSTKIYNYYNEGQYLIWNDIKCFVDSRQFPYTKEVGNGSLDDAIEAISSNDKEEFKKFISKYEFDYIWTNSNMVVIMWAMEDLVDNKEYELIITDYTESENEVKQLLYRKTSN